jgi:hypothetical protein
MKIEGRGRGERRGGGRGRGSRRGKERRRGSRRRRKHGYKKGVNMVRLAVRMISEGVE